MDKAALRSGNEARLFPVLSESSKEGRTLSVFLSCFSLVPRFSAPLLSSINQRVGKQSKINCFTEVVFHSDDASIKDRPDGLIVLDTGRSVWRCLVEAKVGKTDLTVDQLSRYCDLAKKNNIESIVTITNQFTPIPSHHPVSLNKRELKNVSLYHWSWNYILTQARLVLNTEEFFDPIQRHILGDFVEFLRHPSAGVRSFDRMNSEWKGIVEAVKHGQALRMNDEGVQNTVLSWEQESKDLALKLSDSIQRHVGIKLGRISKSDPAARLKSSVKGLCEQNMLAVSYDIPDACSPLHVCADLAARTISCTMRVKAPADMKRAMTRVNWVRGQLKEAEPDVQVKAIWPGGKRATFASLGAVRDGDYGIVEDSKGTAPTAFEIISVLDMGTKFSGVSSFIAGLEPFVIGYYETVGQNLKNWQPSAPKVIESNTDSSEAIGIDSTESEN